MNDIQIDRLTLQVRGLSEADGRRLALRIAEGLGAARPRAGAAISRVFASTWWPARAPARTSWPARSSPSWSDRCSGSRETILPRRPAPEGLTGDGYIDRKARCYRSCRHSSGRCPT